MKTSKIRKSSKIIWVTPQVLINLKVRAAKDEMSLNEEIAKLLFITKSSEQ